MTPEDVSGGLDYQGYLLANYLCQKGNFRQITPKPLQTRFEPRVRRCQILSCARWREFGEVPSHGQYENRRRLKKRKCIPAVTQVRQKRTLKRLGTSLALERCAVAEDLRG